MTTNPLTCNPRINALINTRTHTHTQIGNGVDWDVVARVVSGAGEPLGPGAFFLASSFGREDSPHLAFSPKDNNFGTHPNKARAHLRIVKIPLNNNTNNNDNIL
jgi:hypothetical protein